MSRRLKLIIAYDGTPFAGWQSQSHRNTIQDTSSARLNAFLASRRAFTAPDERTPASMHSRNAHTSIFPTTAYQLHAGAKRSTRCCLLLFAFFAANMCRMIFTRGFRQKEKSIATKPGYPPFCLHSNMVAPGISRVRLISQFSGEQPGSLSVLMILPDSLQTVANKKRARSVQFIRCVSGKQAPV